MKITLRKIFYAALFAASLLVGFCACDDIGWYPDPPYGWDNTFYDSRLDGCWQLVQANSRPVGRYDTNYLDFYGSGRGRYFYYDRGMQASERIAYWSQDAYDNTSYFEINIQYESGSAATMNYWFTDNGRTLWMQWLTNSGTVTYLYRRISDIPW